eukprot:TRINITY_DN35774_c0_g1_i1.p1 TRINITY_DN35774_c0_g1~~TRINITY_DN35774_c0_g1_i1.p1  ORF type:complete len:699 (+),score=225.20 TRINITY_DN35774_c0_g1_i1:414-2510(+)
MLSTFGSPKNATFPGGRRQRSKSMGPPGHRPRRKSRGYLTVGVKVCRVFAKVKGSFGGRFDNLREGGNGSSRQTLIVTSTDREFEVDGIITGEQERTMQQMVADPIIEDLFEGKSHCAMAFGDCGSGKTHAMFWGGEDDLGLVYCCVKAINKRRALKNSNCTVSLSMFELKEDEIRDLQITDARIKPPRITNLDDLMSDELLIEGLTEKVINQNHEAANIITSGLERVREESDANVVVRVRINQYYGTSKKTSILDLVDCYFEERCVRSMINTLREQDFETAFSEGTLTRLSCPKVMRHQEKGFTLISTASSKMNEMAESLQTIKLAKEAFDLRRQVEQSPSGSPGGSPATITGTPGNDFGQSPPGTPTGGPAMYPNMVPEDPLAADRERQLRHNQGLLQATRAIVLKLEQELQEKNVELREEKKARIVAEQDKQDFEKRAQVLKEKVEFEAEKLNELREEVRVKEAQIKSSKVENFELSQDLMRQKTSVMKLEKEKDKVEEDLTGIKTKLEGIVKKRSGPELWMQLRIMLDLPESPRSSTPKRTLSPKARPRGLSTVSNQGSTRSNSRTHTTPTHLNHPHMRFGRAQTSTFNAPQQGEFVINGSMNGTPELKTRTRSPGRPALFNSGPSTKSMERTATSGTYSTVSSPPAFNRSHTSHSPIDSRFPHNYNKTAMFRTRSQERRARSPPPTLRNIDEE